MKETEFLENLSPRDRRILHDAEVMIDIESLRYEALDKKNLKLRSCECYCTLCDENRDCLFWSPKRLNISIPICKKCFVSFSKTFENNGGAIEWY